MKPCVYLEACNNDKNEYEARCLWGDAGGKCIGYDKCESYYPKEPDWRIGRINRLEFEVLKLKAENEELRAEIERLNKENFWLSKDR